MSQLPKNDEKFLEVLRTLDPELYLIKVALEETKLPPHFVSRTIRQVANVNYGTGFGDIKILIRNHTITAIQGTESDLVDSKLDGGEEK